MRKLIRAGTALVLTMAAGSGWSAPTRIPALYHGRWNTDAASCRESEPTTIFGDHILLSDGELRVRSVRVTGKASITVSVHDIAPERAQAGDADQTLKISLVRRHLIIEYPDKNGRQDPDNLIRCH